MFSLVAIRWWKHSARDAPYRKSCLPVTISRHSIIGEIVHLAKGKGIPVEYVPAEAFGQRQAAT